MANTQAPSHVPCMSTNTSCSEQCVGHPSKSTDACPNTIATVTVSILHLPVFPMLDSSDNLRSEMGTKPTFILTVQPLRFELMGGKINLFRVLVLASKMEWKFALRTIVSHHLANRVCLALEFNPNSVPVCTYSLSDPAPSMKIMSVVVWNYSCFDHIDHLLSVTEVLRTHKASIIVLTETMFSGPMSFSSRSASF